MESWIDDKIESSARVRDLLAGRLEHDKDTGKLVKKSLNFRHYLRVKQPEHRKALTKMVLSSNVAVGRNAARRLYPNNRGFADSAIFHAMFQCQHTPLVEIRQAFLTKVEVELPGVAGQFPDALGLFRSSKVSTFSFGADAACTSKNLNVFSTQEHQER
jgi:hypothetical protein